MIIIVTGALNLFVTWAALAQSSFWVNNAYQTVNSPVFDAQGNPLEGSNYAAELWGAATADSLTPAVSYATRQRVIVPFLTGNSAGYFRDAQAWGNYVTVLDVPPIVGLAWLQVRAWDTRLGATYEQAAALGLGGYGESPLFSAHGSYPVDLLGLPGALTGLQSFSLLPVIPEPSSVWLLLLGLPWLLFRCRRVK